MVQPLSAANLVGPLRFGISHIIMGDTPLEDEINVVGENDKVEEKDKQDTNSCDEKILVNAENDKAQRGCNIFHGEEVDISIANEDVHEGVDFPGSLFNVEDRKPRIEN